MSWSKFCRILNFIVCFLFSVVGCILGLAGLLEIMKMNEYYSLIVVGLFFSLYMFEKGTVERLYGRIKDKTLVESIKIDYKDNDD